MIDRESLWVDAPSSPVESAIAEQLLALADDELIIGHRHSEWLGLSPFLEEDLTMASIAQDELGHSRALYALLWPDWSDRDAMVVRRPPSAWRSCSFVEMETSSWAQSLIRHWVYDIAEEVRWNGLVAVAGDAVSGLRELSIKVLQEERFHRMHAQQLVTRLARSGAENHQRLIIAFELIRSHIDSLVTSNSHVRAAQNGAASALVLAFAEKLASAAVLAGLDIDLAATMSRAVVHDRRTRHVGFSSAHDALLDVVAFDPIATW